MTLQLAELDRELGKLHDCCCKILLLLFAYPDVGLKFREGIQSFPFSLVLIHCGNWRDMTYECISAFLSDIRCQLLLLLNSKCHTSYGIVYFST